MRLIFSALLLALTVGVHAETITGRVVGVADGDTVTVLDSQKVQHKIRLSGIDAPEKAQPFGNRSKQNLSDLVFQKEVSVDWQKRDRYGRIVGKVMVQPPDCPTCPKTLDTGQAQLIVGLAWWYRKYASEQSPQDRGRYESEETEARARRAGLWRDAEPVPPWDFRKAKRDGQ
jgi:endonuclease YncB( thermonuclease family)